MAEWKFRVRFRDIRKGDAWESEERGDDGRWGSGSGASNWSPTMTLAEANEWAKGSVVQGTLYHGTSPESAESIREQGFRPSATGAKGSGIYLTANAGAASAWAHDKTKTGGEVLAVRVNVTNPAHPEESQRILDDVKATGAKRSEAVEALATSRGFDALTIPVNGFTYSTTNYTVFDPHKVTVISNV